MAALSDAPFIKVEATKFTEVGYHGRDVDRIIRDLMDIALNLVKKRKTDELRSTAESLVEERVLDLLTGGPKNAPSREAFRVLLKNGGLDDQEIEVLFGVVRELKKEGVAVLYISHFLEELYQICDRVTIMRDGQTVAQHVISETTKLGLISEMLGRDPEEIEALEEAKKANDYPADQWADEEPVTDEQWNAEPEVGAFPAAAVDPALQAPVAPVIAPQQGGGWDGMAQPAPAQDWAAQPVPDAGAGGYLGNSGW